MGLTSSKNTRQQIVAATVELRKSKKCNDYPEREYTQVSGSGEHPEKDDDIVYSA